MKLVKIIFKQHFSSNRGIHGNMVQILLYVQKAEQKVLHAAVQPNIGSIGKSLRLIPSFKLISHDVPPTFQQSSTEVLTLASCTRRLSEFEKRYCFDLIFEERPAITYTFQALSEEDRKAWLNAMDGKEPVLELLSNNLLSY